MPKEDNKPYEVLDAQSGSWVQVYEVNGTAGTSTSATDVQGHAQEKQLTELLKYGVITPDADGKVNPEQEITVGDWLTYVSKATTPYYSQYYMTADKQAVAGVSSDSPYYDAVSFAVSRNWVDAGKSVQPEKKLNREELAVLLSSLLKYSKLASFLDNDSTVTSFSDNAAITNKGAVALVVHLGLLQGEGGKFNPQQNVTKAQAAAVIMKLVELQGKTDQPIGLQ
ncbi:Endo-1,4-beta-xylanase A precursor [compost metagenome]